MCNYFLLFMWQAYVKHLNKIKILYIAIQLCEVYIFSYKLHSGLLLSKTSYDI